jgi:thiamine-phosphate pyrophosphorylase
MPSIQETARRIAAAHPTLQIGHPAPVQDAVRADDAGLPPTEAAARTAARMLGFIEADAAVIGRAWRRRAERLGHGSGLQDTLDWPDEPADFDLGPWPRDGAFAPCPQALGLYVVAPDAAWIARLARAGVPTLQLRFKSDDPAAIQAEVRAAIRAVEGTSSRLFINDHWRIAIEEQAWGVHLGQEDLDTLSTADLDRIRQAGLRLGLSTHGYAEMLRADAVGPSYLALGAVYPTTLKDMPTAPQGPGRLAAYARLMRGRPLVAIGGIDEARFAEVLPSGVGSIAVVRAVIAASDPEAAAQRMMRGLDARAG